MTSGEGVGDIVSARERISGGEGRCADRFAVG